MNTARIVVLIPELSTGGIAACLAVAPAESKPAQTEPVVQLPAMAGLDNARFVIPVSTATQR